VFNGYACSRVVLELFCTFDSSWSAVRKRLSLSEDARRRGSWVEYIVVLKHPVRGYSRRGVSSCPETPERVDSVVKC